MEIHRADLAYRRRSLWLLLALVCACAAGLWLLQDGLRIVQAQVRGGDAEQGRRWLRAAIAGLGLAPVAPLLLWGRSLRRLGRAAREDRRFPPRAWKTYRDVRVLRERAALDWARRTERIGRSAQALAGGFAAAAGLAWWWLS